MKIRLVISAFCICTLSGCFMFRGGNEEVGKRLPSGTDAGAVRPSWGGGRSSHQQAVKSGVRPVASEASRGKVAHVDAALGFVVIDFTFSAQPPAGLRFGVFRNGLRIGEITTTKMIDEAFQVADINKGDIRMGDDVRLD